MARPYNVRVRKFPADRPSAYGGMERYCSDCSTRDPDGDPWWPADGEFFFHGGHGRLMRQCIACYTYKKQLRLRRRKEMMINHENSTKNR